MSIQPSRANQAARQDRAAVDAGIQTKFGLFMLRLAIVVLTGFAVCTWGIPIMNSAGNAPEIVEPPPNFLPGNSLPENVFCNTIYDRRYRCRASYQGEEVYFSTDPSSRLIHTTNITAYSQRIGNLLLVWGKPTEFSRTGQALYVFWGARYAYLKACPFEPTSTIEYIGYGLDGLVLSQLRRPWRGFFRDSC